MITTLLGDSRTTLATVPDKSVQCIVTSPPYFGLRSYLDAADPLKQYELGAEPTPVLYIAALMDVFKECWRVMRDDATLWVNIGDSFSASGMGGNPADSQFRKQATNTGSLIPGRPAPEGLKPKNLLGIPWRLAFALQDFGFYLRSDIIWHKSNCMPESVTDRPTRSHEYVFLLSKQERYFYDQDAIREPHEGTSGWAKQRARGVNTWDYGRDGYNQDRTGGMSGQETFEHPAGRNKRSVWTISTAPYKDAHYATFPEILVETCLLAGSSPCACECCGSPWRRGVERTGHVNKRESAHAPNNCPTKQDSTGWAPLTRATDEWHPTCTCTNEGTGRCVVLDCFAGSGTTGKVAEKHGRDAILCELNAAYLPMIEKRTNNVQTMMEVA